MRSLLLRASAAAVFALALFGSPAMAQDVSTPGNNGTVVINPPASNNSSLLQTGQECSNEQALLCDSGLRCYSNVCGVYIEDSPAGFGNKCDENDCCPQLTENGEPSKLVCNKATGRCGPSVVFVPEITCGGGEYTPGNSTDSGRLQAGQECSNEQALQCDSGLRCYDNKCAIYIEVSPAGFGNKCSSSDCCPTLREDGTPSKLVCNKATGRCGPSVPLVTELTCGGGETTPTVGDNDDGDDTVVDNPQPGDTTVIGGDGSSGTIVINPDGSVETDSAAPATATAATALTLAAGVAIAAIML